MHQLISVSHKTHQPHHWCQLPQLISQACLALCLQTEIVRLVSNTNRGKSAPPKQRSEILEKIQELEACNSTPNPARSKLLSGRWALLYQAPLTIAAAKDNSSTLEGAWRNNLCNTR